MLSNFSLENLLKTFFIDIQKNKIEANLSFFISYALISQLSLCISYINVSFPENGLLNTSSEVAWCRLLGVPGGNL